MANLQFLQQRYFLNQSILTNSIGINLNRPMSTHCAGSFLKRAARGVLTGLYLTIFVYAYINNT